MLTNLNKKESNMLADLESMSRYIHDLESINAKLRADLDTK
jgi:hypothetical protein